MALPPLSESERRATVTSARRVTELIAQVRSAARSVAQFESTLRAALFALWVANVRRGGTDTPSWSIHGYSSFEDMAGALGVHAEFCRKAVRVHEAFYASDGSLRGFDTRRAQPVQKMHQVYRVARSVREANEWLVVAEEATTEELEKLVKTELKKREGTDSRSHPITGHVHGDDVAVYLNWTRDSIAMHGSETNGERLMRAIRFHVESGRLRRRT